MKYIAHRLRLIFLNIFFVIGIILMVSQMSFSADKKENNNFNVIINKSIFFAHQSVGRNILDGVRDLIVDSPEKLNIFNFTGQLNIEKPGIYHTLIGKNTKPESKIDDFYNRIKQSRKKPDIAFLKLCFVDIDAETDVEKIFLYYKRIFKKIEMEYPSIKIVYFTVPLKTSNVTWKTKIKKILGMDAWEYSSNIKRNEFNNLLLVEFGNRGSVFDLAKFESLYPDGKREKFTLGNTDYYALAPEYTTDGGHLNKVGRDWVAQHLLSFLVNLGL